MCPASCRVIRVVNDTFTLEFELEEEDTKKLIEELQRTDWGRRLATLLGDMMPAIEEKFSITQAKTKFLEEYKDFIEDGKIARVDIGEEGTREILIVWINCAIDLPSEFCEFEIVERKSPNYQEEKPNPTDGSDVY